ncbi:hypothetical protein H4R19_004046 [Coemansia spiralis]|nr:hypothetical protein H4R19_004046 [Coemansia spiralis]
MRGVAGEWAGVRKLVLSLDAWGNRESEVYSPATNYEDEIASVSSALAALMPGLREIAFDDSPHTPISGALFGQLAGLYADQLQVLRSNGQFIVPQGLVFARLRKVKIISYCSVSLEDQLPWLDPEVVESLALEGLAANEMWSMFCADSGGCAITFPQLTNLNLSYFQTNRTTSERLSVERPWALQFPVAKHVRISWLGEECPSMENAVFPDCLESLDISACLGALSVFAGRKVHVSQNLSLSVAFKSNANNHSIDIANRMLEAADSYNMRKLAISGMHAVPPELISYTGLTHLELVGPANADDVMELIRRQRHLVSLWVGSLTLANAQTDFSVPERAEHEPVAPLDTQIRNLNIIYAGQEVLSKLGTRMLKYLLLKIPTLKSVTALFAPSEQILAFIEEYVQWYPHLANIYFMM